MFYPFGSEWKEITVGDAFTDDGRLWTYPYTQKGFFQLLDKANQPTHYGNAYTTEEGNPIELWRMPIIESDIEVGYSGISYEELDFMFLSRYADRILRNRYVKTCIGVPPDIGPVEPRKDATNNCVIPIVRMYRNKWVELWETMFYEYEPLWNYDMTEILTDDIKEINHGHVITLENGKTMTRSGSVTNTPGTTYTETQSVKGFDSSNWSDSDKSVSTPSGNGDVTNYSNLKDTASGTDTTRNQGTDKETRNYTLTRTGNIGVTTSMELIQKQRQVLMFDYFNNIVFPDIDKEIALKIY